MAHKTHQKQIVEFTIFVRPTVLTGSARCSTKENDEVKFLSGLIEKGYLSNADTFSYDVNLHGLKIGTNGDFTINSSDTLYSNYFMQEKLIFAYEEVSLGQKTLIFNAGIETSRRVYESFKKLKHPIRHLDSTFSDKDRKETFA